MQDMPHAKTTTFVNVAKAILRFDRFKIYSLPIKQISAREKLHVRVSSTIANMGSAVYYKNKAHLRMGSRGIKSLMIGRFHFNLKDNFVTIKL